MQQLPLAPDFHKERNWPAMTANSGRSNRVGFARYREWLANSNLEGELIVTALIGSDARFEDARFAPPSVCEARWLKSPGCVGGLHAACAGTATPISR
jgi:hypothetical protein